MPRGKKVIYKKFDTGSISCEVPRQCVAEPVKEETKAVSNFSTARVAEANSVENVLKEIHNKTYIPSVRNKIFYLIHINWFCVTDDDVFYPAELGLIEFSLETGVTSTYHKIINSGPLPLGYAFEAKRHADDTHAIPTETGEGEYYWILKAIRNTLTKGENCKELPPLYTMPDYSSHYYSLSAVKSTLLTICEGAGCPDEYDRFRVFSLSDLFFEMKNIISWQINGRYAFSKLQNAEVELQKVAYTHSQWISCNFHHENERREYCSLAIVHCWAYIICENFCDDLLIEMVEGKHKPLKTVPRTFYNRSSLRPKRSKSKERLRRGSKKCNDVTELQSSLPERLEQLEITKDPQRDNMKEIIFNTGGGSDVNSKDNKTKTLANVVSGIEDYPQLSERNFPAIGCGKKSNRYTKR